MNRVRILMNDSHWRYWIFSILIGVLLPFILKICRTPSVFIDMWFLIVLNIAVSFVVGNLIKTSQLKWFMLFVFPLTFLVGAFLLLPRYSYYFALIYFCIEFLSYSMVKD